MTLSRTTIALGLLALLGLLAGIVAVAGPAAGDGVAAKKKRVKPKTVLVSRRSAKQGAAAGNATSEFPKVSASGRYVAFTSEATNLGGPAFRNAYVYDRRRKRLRFIARANGPGRAAANDDSRVEAISANGRFVAFSTDATNLGGAITLGTSNVYVYDRKRKRVELVSRASRRRGPGADDDSGDAAISAGGRYVAFSTEADNLGGPLDTGVANVYVYDRKAKRVRLVSRQGGGGTGGDGDSGRPAISAGGRRVAFESEADNLGGLLDTGVSNIYAHDLERRRVALVSRQGPAAGGLGGNEDSNNASISADGRFVAFRTFADNLGGPIETESNIYLHDHRRKKVQLISRQPGPGGLGADAVSYHASVSGDGRYVAFDSEATNLGGPITAGVGNVYLLDRKRNRLELVSRRSGRRGAGGDRSSFDPHISPSGRFVAFVSQANNLSAAAPGFPFSSAYLRDRGR